MAATGRRSQASTLKVVLKLKEKGVELLPLRGGEWLHERPKNSPEGACGRLGAQAFDHRQWRHDDPAGPQLVQNGPRQDHSLVALKGERQQPRRQLPVAGSRERAVAIGIHDELEVFSARLVPFGVLRPLSKDLTRAAARQRP